jgi:hypothetical protein
MNHSELEIFFEDILSNLSDYALVRTEASKSSKAFYSIYSISIQSWIVVEEGFEDLVNLMLERKVRVVDDVKEVRIKDFVRYVMKWDEATKSFIKIPAP